MFINNSQTGFDNNLASLLLDTGQGLLLLIFDVLFNQQTILTCASELAQMIVENSHSYERRTQVVRIWKQMPDKRLKDSYTSAIDLVTKISPSWKCTELNQVLEIVVQQISSGDCDAAETTLVVKLLLKNEAKATQLLDSKRTLLVECATSKIPVQQNIALTLLPYVDMTREFDLASQSDDIGWVKTICSVQATDWRQRAADS